VIDCLFYSMILLMTKADVTSSAMNVELSRLMEAPPLGSGVTEVLGVDDCVVSPVGGAVVLVAVAGSELVVSPVIVVVAGSELVVSPVIVAVIVAIEVVVVPVPVLLSVVPVSVPVDVGVVMVVVN